MRDVIQSKAKQKLLDYNFNGILDIAPRVGKSKILLDAVKEYNNKTFVILYPLKEIEQSWLEEIKLWKVGNNKVITMDQRYLDFDILDNADFIISDEIHSLSSRQVENLVKYSKKLGGLTGSLGFESKLNLKESLNLITTYKYSISEAIKDKIISNFEINLIPCKLSNYEYVKVNNKLQTEKQRYESLTRMYEKVRIASYQNLTSKLSKLKIAGKRSNFIYKAPTKVKRVQEFLKGIDRALIFTARIAVADKLSESYHGKSKLNTLELFKNESINKLTVADKVSMGVTIPNLKIGVFHQLKSNQEYAIQKILRMCNLDDDKIARIYIFFYENTVDEIWVKKALSLFPKEKIKFMT